ncbi:ADP-glyceromanno-heptose 6-epimerase [Rouxiella badensis]|uniref:ADP-glyceromanno-heptose 6-epimerase n=1 Tax=Rouxiella badensis TaxID=1646377 RepID=UPI00178845E9|nr:ADP-glyceromanno-heptose 6-epimerase [Rouxiella badensis]QOI54610.1 ADP-glyceromanno-heptose 6-epimerase [Rouxiella badensis subsp. acadiensis]
MILLTGAAGFIGSNVLSSLNKTGITDVVICDAMGCDEKWRNISNCEFSDFIPLSKLDAWLEKKPKIEAIIHLGAKSETTAVDADDVLENNFSRSVRLWKFCAENEVTFIYASSSCTYGDGSEGFKDHQSPRFLNKLTPLNLYSWSKNIFDLRVARDVENKNIQTPKHWYGLKLFNVYGPGEYHKGNMKSSVGNICQSVLNDKPVILFKSEIPEFNDGEQSRDFIYIDDVTQVINWLLVTQPQSGIYNVGTGEANSFLTIAKTAFDLSQRKQNIHFAPFPEVLKEKAQYFTQADISKIRAAGYTSSFTPLREGMAKYIEYLKQVGG